MTRFVAAPLRYGTPGSECGWSSQRPPSRSHSFQPRQPSSRPWCRDPHPSCSARISLHKLRYSPQMCTSPLNFRFALALAVPRARRVPPLHGDASRRSCTGPAPPPGQLLQRWRCSRPQKEQSHTSSGVWRPLRHRRPPPPPRRSGAPAGWLRPNAAAASRIDAPPSCRRRTARWKSARATSAACSASMRRSSAMRACSRRWGSTAMCLST